MHRTNLVVSAFVLSLALASQAQAAQGKGVSQTPREAAISRLSAESGARVTVDEATGTARFVRVAPGARLGQRTIGTEAAKQASGHQFLNAHAAAFGITSPATELTAPRLSKDRHGGSHFTYKQVYEGVPVYGGELKTHFNAAHELTAVNGKFIPGITVNPKPTRTADQALAVAIAQVQADTGRTVQALKSPPTLMIYRAGLAQGVAGSNHLAWHVEVGNGFDVRQFVIVDAHSGKIIDSISGIHDAKNRRAFDANGATAPGPNYPGSPFWVEGQAFPTGTLEADNMLAASADIYDLFKNAFGRDSFDGNGATMDSIFNRGNGCPNASWNGVFISFCPGLTTDDVTAHEWAHAYTEYTHALIYQWQPGALNEAYSDIWGETVDRLNGRGGDTPDAARTDGVCTVSTPLRPTVTITAPAAIAGILPAGTADFGPQTFSVSGDVVGVGVGTNNAGCTLPFAENVAGKIAFIDRGTCGFGLKSLNAQSSGAIAVVIGDNAGGNTVAGMTGGSAANTIPALRVSQNSGTAIKSQLGVGVNLTLTRGGNGSANSVRWLMGEDSTAPGLVGALRDMYNPTCYGNPGKVSDAQYVCTFAGDNGGVHSNSGVPNHAYALLVDGGSFNGQTIAPIGITKAAHIYYRAQSVYQNLTSNFSDHADAIEQSCADLTGANLASLSTGAPSGEVITASDCTQVAAAALAVELRSPPAQCNFQTLLAKTPPALCTTGSPTSLMSDNFDGGKRGGVRWTVSKGGAQDFTGANWAVITKLPRNRPGYAIFAANPDVGTCGPGGDETGLMRLESPEITVPAGVSGAQLRMTFDHMVATEPQFDGGNIKVSVNGGAWQLVPATDFVYNPYNSTLLTSGAGNTNPLQGQPAFTGTDGGDVSGSWGRSILKLPASVVAGDKIKVRFELGRDGCGGLFGWYVDDVMVYSCPAQP